MNLKLKLDRFDLFIFILTVCVFILVLIAPFKATPYGDMYFLEEARQFALFFKGDFPFSDLFISKAPFPVFFYTVPFMFVPSNGSYHDYWAASVIWTAIWMVFSMLLLRRAGRYIFNETTGKITALLFVLFPIHIYYSLGVLAEPVAFFAIIVFLYAWSKWKFGNYKTFYLNKYWWLMNIGASFVIMSRPNAILILLLAAVCVLMMFVWRRMLFRKLGVPILSFIAVTFIFGFVVLRSVQALPGEVVGREQNTQLYYVMHQGKFQFRTEPFDWRFWESDIRQDSKDYQDWLVSKDEIKEEVKAGKISAKDGYKNFVINDYISHPFISVRQVFVKAINGHFYIINSVKPSKMKLGIIPGEITYFIFLLILNSIHILTLICAIVMMVKYRSYMLEYWPLWVPWVALVVFHSLVYMEPRYLLPSKPGLFLMAAFVLANIPFIKKKFTSTQAEPEIKDEFAII